MEILSFMDLSQGPLLKETAFWAHCSFYISLVYVCSHDLLAVLVWIAYILSPQTRDPQSIHFGIPLSGHMVGVSVTSWLHHPLLMVV
jgi:hypothetical protein